MQSCSKAYSGQASAEDSWNQFLHGILEMVMGNVQCVKICLVGALMSSENQLTVGVLDCYRPLRGNKKSFNLSLNLTER